MRSLHIIFTCDYIDDDKAEDLLDLVMTAAVDDDGGPPEADGVYDKPEDRLELEMMADGNIDTDLSDGNIDIDLPDADEVNDKPEDHLELKMVADSDEDPTDKTVDDVEAEANPEDELDLALTEELPTATERPDQAQKPDDGEFIIVLVVQLYLHSYTFIFALCSH